MIKLKKISTARIFLSSVVFNVLILPIVFASVYKLFVIVDVFEGSQSVCLIYYALSFILLMATFFYLLPRVAKNLIPMVLAAFASIVLSFFFATIGANVLFGVWYLLKLPNIDLM